MKEAIIELDNGYRIVGHPSMRWRFQLFIEGNYPPNLSYWSPRGIFEKLEAALEQYNDLITRDT